MSVALAWLIGCAGFLSFQASGQTVAVGNAKNYLPVIVVCRADSEDQILGYICRRIEADAPGLATEYGMRLTVEYGPVSDAHWTPPRDTVPLEIVLTANRPESQFGTKEIAAQLTAPAIEPGDAPWSSAFVATGVPRDLVHPVADATLERIGAFLGDRRLGERDTSTRIATQR